MSETQGPSKPDARPYTLDADEYYPFMMLDPPKMNEVHPDRLSRRKRHVLLTDEQFADYERVMAEFGAWQERLRDADGHSRAGEDPYLLP